MKLSRLAILMTLSCASASVLSSAYNVQELATQSLSTNTYGTSIDDTGLILTVIEDIYNAPIDISLLPLDQDALINSLTDVEGVRNGQINDVDYAFLISSLRTAARSESQFSQPFARYLAYSSDGTTQNFINANDTFSESLGSFTYSMDTIAVDSVNGTHIIANSEGPFSLLEYTTDTDDELTFILPEFDQRAIVQVGDQVTQLIPQDTTLGGVSRVTSINDNYQVVGSTSVNITAAFEAAILNCNDDDVRSDIPAESCLRSLLFSTTTNGVSRQTITWINRAAVWDLDSQGQVVDTTVYGLTFEPTDEQSRSTQFFSQALAINNAGQAVGTSTVLFSGDRITAGATLYENGESKRLIPEDEFLPNSAIGINDNGLVVGIRQQVINSATREKMFIHNIATGETEFIQGFFESSSTTPRAINQNNIVVGNAEINAGTVNSVRRRAGFIFDIDNNTFTDINTLLACDSEYSVIEAIDINNSGDIVATALTKRPERNVQGQIVLNDAGEQTLVDTVVTLKLTPSGQNAPDCSDTEEDIASERQGASINVGLFGLLLMATWLRVFRNK